MQKALAIYATLLALVAFVIPAPISQSVDLGYESVTLPEDVRRPDDCAQFAMYTVLVNEGCNVDASAFERMLQVKHENGGTSVSSLQRQLWPWMPAQYHQTGRTIHLKRQLDQGRPAIVVTLWDFEDRAAFGHGMVVTGYDSGSWKVLDDRGEFTISDDFFRSIWSGQWIEVGDRS